MTTNGHRALLAADTDRTLDYVFESAKLPEIRGASTILDDLNREESPDLIDRLDDSASEIYVGGGGLLYDVDADKAPQIQEELEALYPQETNVATTTCVYRVLPRPANEGVPQAPLDTEELSGFGRQRFEHADKDLDCFGAWVRLLGHDLRRRKKEKNRLPFVEAMPYAKRCRSCRTRPAEGIYPHYEEERPLCPACVKKKRNNQRSPWRDAFQKRLREWYPELAEDYFAKAEGGNVFMPRDIKVIARACRPRNPNKRGYVAFIYADGDGVGAFVESRRTREEYERVSKIIEEATWRAVTFALGSNLAVERLENPLGEQPPEEDVKPRPTQPFEIITVGGDDVMLIAPAHAALPIARSMAGEFTRFLDEKENVPTLSLSVGLVIAPMHMPVRLMRDFALDLLKKGAKRRARKENGAAVDFQVFTSTAIQGADVMATRGHPPYTVAQPDDPEGKPLRLFQRPYSLAELDRLLGVLDEMKGVDFPTSQLYPLAAALEKGRRRSTLFYLYQRSRLGKKHREALAQVEAIARADPDEDPAPWYRAPFKRSFAFSTALRDVVELYDFVPVSEQEVSA